MLQSIALDRRIFTFGVARKGLGGCPHCNNPRFKSLSDYNTIVLRVGYAHNVIH